MVKDGLPTLLIKDIEINRDQRRKGYASLAFNLVERFAKQNNVNQVVLHVFKTNKTVQALCQKLAFQVTGLNMLKGLV